MLTRVKQFIAALTARITPSDRTFVSKYLNYKEEVLFWQMNLPDQRHALNVAYTALAFGDVNGAEELLLVKSSLLHDVGKIQGDISTMDKVIAVLFHKFAPRYAYRWGRLGRGSKLQNLRHAFYIYFHHAERGAVLLSQIGTKGKILDVVRRHHEPKTEADPIELILLRKADNKN